MATVAIRIWNLIYVEHVRNVWKKKEIILNDSVECKQLIST